MNKPSRRLRVAAAVLLVAAAALAAAAAALLQWITCDVPSSDMCERQGTADLQLVVALVALGVAAGAGVAVRAKRDRASSLLLAAAAALLAGWAAVAFSLYG